MTNENKLFLMIVGTFVLVVGTIIQGAEQSIKIEQLTKILGKRA